MGVPPHPYLQGWPRNLVSSVYVSEGQHHILPGPLYAQVVGLRGRPTETAPEVSITWPLESLFFLPCSLVVMFSSTPHEWSGSFLWNKVLP